MNQPPHSIVIPVFNGAAFLRDCLESVRAQQFQDWECVVCDNGSVDGSAQIAEEWIRSSADPRFRLVRFDKPQGMTADWNRAVGLARGEWVRLLPCDDLLTPNALDDTNQLLATQHNLGMVLNGKQVLDKRGAILFDRMGIGAGPVNAQKHTARALLGFAGNELGDPGCVSFRRDLWARLGGFDTDFRYLPDLDFWLRILAEAPAVHTGRIGTGFRIHGSGLTLRNQWVAVSEYRKLRRKHRPGDGGHLLGAACAVLGTLARVVVLSWIVLFKNR